MNLCWFWDVIQLIGASQKLVISYNCLDGVYPSTKYSIQFCYVVDHFNFPSINLLNIIVICRLCIYSFKIRRHFQKECFISLIYKSYSWILKERCRKETGVEGQNNGLQLWWILLSIYIHTGEPAISFQKQLKVKWE